MYFILADVWITRRKRTHIVVNEDGDTQFAASALNDVLSWLWSMDQTQVMISLPDHSYYQVHLRHINRALLDLSDRERHAQAVQDAEKADPRLPGF